MALTSPNCPANKSRLPGWNVMRERCAVNEKLYALGSTTLAFVASRCI